jgi:glucose uptake protein
MVVSMICWGSWANTFKLTRGRLRFELFYWDYAIGLAVTAFIAAIIVGHFSAPGEFPSSLFAAHRVPILWALMSGIVFNLANLLLVAAIAVAGLAVAFPVAIGTALIVGTALTFLVDQKGVPLYICAGVILAAFAVICCAAAYRAQTSEIKVTRKGVIICLISGLLMASWAPLAAASMQRAPGYLTPLSSFIVFAVGVVASTVPFNLYFMRRPIVGGPVSMHSYCRSPLRWHALGLLGGSIWSIGTLSNLIAGNSAGFAISYAIGQSAPLVASLWGIFVWKEFAAAGPQSKRALAAMFLFYVAAIAVLAQAL